MDEIDIAQIENERHLERSLLSFNISKNKEKERLQSMEKHGILNKCLYCEEALNGYGSAFCDTEDDWSCRSEYEKEQGAIRSGRVTKILE